MRRLLSRIFDYFYFLKSKNRGRPTGNLHHLNERPMHPAPSMSRNTSISCPDVLGRISHRAEGGALRHFHDILVLFFLFFRLGSAPFEKAVTIADGDPATVSVFRSVAPSIRA